MKILYFSIPGQVYTEQLMWFLFLYDIRSIFRSLVSPDSSYQLFMISCWLYFLFESGFVSELGNAIYALIVGQMT